MIRIALVIAWVFLVSGFANQIQAQENYSIGQVIAGYKEVQREIDATDEQYQRARKIVGDWFTRVNTMTREFREKFPQAPPEANDRAIEDFIAKDRAALSEVFLPDQMERLDELANWAATNRYGFYPWLTQKESQKILGTTEGKVGNLKDEAESLQIEFDEAAFELRQKYRQKLLEKLTDEQRQKLKEILGDPTKLGQPSIKF